MPLQFREFAAQKIQEQKSLLDKLPPTGTIQNYLKRYRIFRKGLMMLHQEFETMANDLIQQELQADREDPYLKPELFSIIKNSIQEYEKYFKRI